MKRLLFSVVTFLVCFLPSTAQYPERFRNGDPIPDYSRVGYHWGDREIPDVSVVRTLRAPKKGEDATALIQEAVDNSKSPGAILLKAGTYNISGTIRLNRSGIVLRGEGEKTVLVSTGCGQKSLIRMSAPSSQPSYGASSKITEDVPCGQMWVRVADARKFKVGDRVVVKRIGNDKWIHDIRMDCIEARPGREIKQWSPKEYTLLYERFVTGIEGDILFFENPLVMEITGQYGGGSVQKYSKDRVSECGVEDMHLVSEFDKSGTDPKKGYYNDEDHAWNAVAVGDAEHCWVRRVSSEYFGYSLCSLQRGCKNITVSDCHSFSPVSIITGGRRYAFNLSGQQCLVKDCSCDEDRHQFVTHARAAGPNVFLRCTATNSFSDCGPHHRWATGVLYDCVTVDGPFNIQDRGDSGTGHGWAGANFILWNCEAGMFKVQSPWVSAKNYAVGCVGPRDTTDRYREHRPQGVWESYDAHVTPASLYEYQFSMRREKGVKAVPFDK